MTQFGYLHGFGSGEGEMKQFYFQIVFTAVLLISGIHFEFWTDGAVIGLIVFFAIIDLISYTYHLARARTKLFVFEQGVMGTSTKGLFGTTEFALPYNQVMSISTKKNAVVLHTATGKLTCVSANTAQLEAQIRERLTALQQASYSTNL